MSKVEVLNGGLLDILGIKCVFQAREAEILRWVQISLYPSPPLTSCCVKKVGFPKSRIPRYSLSYIENTLGGDLEV
jgi:hypothetical protein